MASAEPGVLSSDSAHDSIGPTSEPGPWARGPVYKYQARVPDACIYSLLVFGFQCFDTSVMVMTSLIFDLRATSKRSHFEKAVYVRLVCEPTCSGIKLSLDFQDVKAKRPGQFLKHLEFNF